MGLRFVDGSMPGIEAHIDLLPEGQRSKMSVAAAQVVDRRRKRQILIKAWFHRPQQGAKRGKVSQLQEEEILRLGFGHQNFRSIRPWNSFSYSAATAFGS